MIISKNDISKFERVKRLKLINSICGIRGVHLIGTKSNDNINNLAIFSSVAHLGSYPPLLSMVSRPSDLVKRNTMKNIINTNYYTINSIEKKFYKKAHKSSGKFPEKISEFNECNLTDEYINNFYSPFVKESNIKIGMKLLDIIEVKHNKTFIIIGEIELIKTKFKKLERNFVNSTSVIGLNTYYECKKINELEYVRVNNKN